MADRFKVTAEKLALNITQAIEQKTWENSQLRQELDYERRKYQASYRARAYIALEADRAVKSLEQALSNLRNLEEAMEESNVTLDT
jgi:hypothetical protein